MSKVMKSIERIQTTSGVELHQKPDGDSFELHIPVMSEDSGKASITMPIDSLKKVSVSSSGRLGAGKVGDATVVEINTKIDRNTYDRTEFVVVKAEANSITQDVRSLIAFKSKKGLGAPMGSFKPLAIGVVMGIIGTIAYSLLTLPPEIKAKLAQAQQRNVQMQQQPQQPIAQTSSAETWEPAE